MKRGFTLIELLVVVLIIGILASVALPQYQKAVEKSRAVQAITFIRSMGDAQAAYYLENGNYAQDIQELSIDFPGELVTNYGYGTNAVKTENFICRGASSSGYTDAIAYCNRSPYHQFYGIGQLKDGRLFCYGYNDEGIKICQRFGKQTVAIAGAGLPGYVFN